MLERSNRRALRVRSARPNISLECPIARPSSNSSSSSSGSSSSSSSSLFICFEAVLVSCVIYVHVSVSYTSCENH